MARKQTQINHDTGKVETRKIKGQRGVSPDSTANFPWTAGPSTRGQRILRNLIG